MQRVLVASVLIAGVLCPLPCLFADDGPSVNEIQQRITKLDSASDATKSFVVRGTVVLGDGLEFSAVIAHRKPDDWLVKICDARDETPIVWMKNRELLFYAPGNGAIFHSQSAKFQFQTIEDGDKCGLSVGFGNGSDPSQFLFDPRLVLGNLKSSSVKHIRDRIYELQLTSNNNNQATLVVDLARNQVLQSIELRLDGASKPTLAIKSVRWNEEIPDRMFAFPDLTDLKRVTKIEDLKFNSSAEVIAFLGRIAESVLIRMGIEKPELRQQLRIQPKLEWGAVQSKDRRISAVLRGEEPPPGDEAVEAISDESDTEPKRTALGRKPIKRRT